MKTKEIIDDYNNLLKILKKKINNSNKMFLMIFRGSKS